MPPWDLICPLCSRFNLRRRRRRDQVESGRKKKKKRREILDSSRMVSNRYRNVVESIVYFPPLFPSLFLSNLKESICIGLNGIIDILVCAKGNYYKKEKKCILILLHKCILFFNHKGMINQLLDKKKTKSSMDLKNWILDI